MRKWDTHHKSIHRPWWIRPPPAQRRPRRQNILQESKKSSGEKWLPTSTATGAKSQKSVIVTRVDDAVYERTENDIIREFKDKNIYVGDDLDSIYKFPNSNTIKLTFTKTQTAKKCTETGIKGFGISIPHFDIKQETYIPILCCLKCYELENHTTRECPKGPNFKMCSECSSDEHLWYECKSKELRVCIWLG